MLRYKLIGFLLCLVLAGAWVSPAEAQVRFPPGVSEELAPIVLAQSREGGLFRSLFGKRRKPVRGGDFRRDDRRTKRRSGETKRRKKSTTARAAPVPAEVVKKDDAKRVLVVGDFMANALAKGLIETFAANPDILVINGSNGSSGLVRDDYYNWNTSMPELVAQHQANLILVMVGANDRQAISSQGKKIQTADEAWRPAYDARITAFAEVLSGQGLPVVWLGLAPVAKASLSRDYSVFNTLFRQKAELKGFKFVDIWNGFADDKGRYVARGPDINGQARTLRGSGGLSFTRAGRRKLAFFVERDVVKFLSDPQAALFAALGDPGSSGPAEPAISAMMPIESISIKPGSELSVAPQPEIEMGDFEFESDLESELVAEENAVRNPELASAGEAGDTVPLRVTPSPTGRADNFTWPPPQ